MQVESARKGTGELVEPVKSTYHSNLPLAKCFIFSQLGNNKFGGKKTPLVNTTLSFTESTDSTSALLDSILNPSNLSCRVNTSRSAAAALLQHLDLESLGFKKIKFLFQIKMLKIKLCYDTSNLLFNLFSFTWNTSCLL